MKRHKIGIAILAAVMLAGAFAAVAAAAAPDTEVKKLTASDAQADHNFGFSVAVSGDTAVVGAAGDDAGGSDAGAAYVFGQGEGGAANWGQVKKLTASDAQDFDRLGASAALSGDTAVVGAITEDAPVAADAGAAYVFQRDQGGVDNWGQVKKLIASDAQASDQFGFSAAASGDVTIVGANGEDAGGGNAGAVYIFQRDQGSADNWGEVKKLTASDAQTNDFFGWSVSISNDTVVVGANGEDAGGSDAGAAYVFEQDEGGANNWGQVKKLTASDAQCCDRFGISVAISGETAVVGANVEDAGGSTNAGAAYVFRRDEGGAGNWGETKKLTASDAQAFDRFGNSVVSGEIAVVGASREDEKASDAGAAYVFGPEFTNTAPAVSADTATVTVDEGQTAENTGTVSDDDGDTVALSASVGSVTNNNDGTWSWSFDTSDGPAEGDTGSPSMPTTATAASTASNLSWS